MLEVACHTFFFVAETCLKLFVTNKKKYQFVLFICDVLGNHVRLFLQESSCV